jgi:hypothetical protein
MGSITKKLTAAFVGAVALAVLSTASHAATVTTIFNTGVDASGKVMALGSTDTHYSGAPNQVYSNSNYLANDAVGSTGSAWLGADSVGATSDYTVHFTLASVSSAILSGSWATDNVGLDILVNGQSTGITLNDHTINAFNQMHGFSAALASTFFLVGDNTLTFKVGNDDPGLIGAFRAANVSVAATPIPPSILMFLTAIGGMGFVAYRRRKGSLAA